MDVEGGGGGCQVGGGGDMAERGRGIKQIVDNCLQLSTAVYSQKVVYDSKWLLTD